MADFEHYDEWGNYIGPELPQDDGVGAGAEAGAGGADDGESDAGGAAWPEDAEGVPDEAPGAGGGGGDAIMLHGGACGGYGGGGAIVLHEDRKLYPDADEVYPEAETLVQDEDTQPLTQPIVAPVEVRAFSATEEAPPVTRYSPEFLTALMGQPSLMRNVALVGHLHHGKTTLADLLIEATLAEKWEAGVNVRYTDARSDEQARGISVKATPFSVVLPSLAGKSHLLNCVDTPGHVNFSDEVCAGLRLADGALLVVDAVEGALLATERAVRAAVAEGLPIVLVVAKVDRLILDLKLPPGDAYHKLVHVIAEVNALIAAASPGGAPPRLVSPLDGSVVFAGALHGWSFTLQSFAALYASRWRGLGSSSGSAGGVRAAAESGSGSGSAAAGAAAAAGAGGVDAAALAKRLWGDVWYDPATRGFRRSAPHGGAPRSFVHFVLEPLYKIYSTVVGEEARAVGALAAELGVRLKPAQLRLDVRPLLKLILHGFLGGCEGIAEAVVRHVPSPAAAAPALVARLYAGDADAPEAAAMRACDAGGTLMVNVVKLLSNADATAFYALGRVMSGTVEPGQRVRVLGEGYSAEDAEDMQLAAVRGVSVGQARYRLEVSRATPGCVVLLEGLGDAIAKSATLTSAGDEAADVAILRPVVHNTTACVNVSVEPLNPSELPKVLAGLRALTKSYPLARTRVEESGEHVLIGTGELALDSMLRDLRDMYARVEVKVADPVVSFAETAVEQSSIACFALTPNKHNKFTVLAEPLDKGLAEDIEAGGVDLLGWPKKRTADYFQQRYGWDVLAARSVWAFGPSPERGPNVLLDDTLAGETDKRALGAVRDSLVQGFQWGCREGPLCDEPVRNVKFKLVAAEVAGEPIQRGGGQVIPTARRVVYSSFLLATPRLMEPVYNVEVLCPGETVQAVHAVLQRRRGHVVSEAPRPGTPFFVVRGFLPVMDSFGFETDLRIFTQGQAFALQVFDHWAIVPGDPMDKSIVLRPLEPSAPHALAREFMVKTRRRKGLAEDVSPLKFFDQEMLVALAQQDAEDAGGAGGML